MSCTTLAAPVKAGAGRAVTRLTDHIPAARAFVNAVVEFLDGLPFSPDSDARKLRIQAAGLMKLLPPDPPADLTPLAELCAVCDGMTRRFVDRCEGFDQATLHWPESAVLDLAGVAYHLAEIGDHLPPVPASLRDRPTAPDAPDKSPKVQLAEVLVRLEDVERQADERAGRLRFDDPLGHRLQALAWSIRSGGGCLWGEVMVTEGDAAWDRYEAEGL